MVGRESGDRIPHEAMAVGMELRPPTRGGLRLGYGCSTPILMNRCKVSEGK